MYDFLKSYFDAVIGINWLAVIKIAPSWIMAAIAFSALRNWKRQDKAKREAEFLDALIEAAHTYIAEIPKPITLLEMAKIGMKSHAPTWENGDETDKAIKGAIAYIQKNGERDAKRFLDVLEAVQPSTIKLRSLAAKGQIFNFDGYAKCQNAVEILTRQFGRIEAFMAFIGSPTWNWENPEVLNHLKDLMTIDPDEIRKSLRESNIVIINFFRETYKRTYG